MRNFTSFTAAAKGFSPPSITGLSLWLRGDLGVTAGATFTWADQSGTGDPNKNVSSTGTDRPTLVASNAAFNNKPTVNFVGGFLLSGVWAVPLPQPYTAIIVGDTPTVASQYVFSDGAAGGAWGADSATGAPSFFASLGVIQSSGSWNAPSVLEIAANGASSDLFFNSKTSTKVSGTNPGPDAITRVRIGNYMTGTTFDWGHGSTGPVAEVIVYNHALSLAERTQVLGYIGARYAIAIA